MKEKKSQGIEAISETFSVIILEKSKLFDV
jgi:hypothetical protein